MVGAMAAGGEGRELWRQGTSRQFGPGQRLLDRGVLCRASRSSRKGKKRKYTRTKEQQLAGCLCALHERSVTGGMAASVGPVVCLVALEWLLSDPAGVGGVQDNTMALPREAVAGHGRAPRSPPLHTWPGTTRAGGAAQAGSVAVASCPPTRESRVEQGHHQKIETTPRQSISGQFETNLRETMTIFVFFDRLWAPVTTSWTQGIGSPRSMEARSPEFGQDVPGDLCDPKVLVLCTCSPIPRKPDKCLVIILCNLVKYRNYRAAETCTSNNVLSVNNSRVPCSVQIQ